MSFTHFTFVSCIQPHPRHQHEHALHEAEMQSLIQHTHGEEDAASQVSNSDGPPKLKARSKFESNEGCSGRFRVLDLMHVVYAFLCHSKQVLMNS